MAFQLWCHIMLEGKRVTLHDQTLCTFRRAASINWQIKLETSNNLDTNDCLRIVYQPSLYYLCWENVNVIEWINKIGTERENEMSSSTHLHLLRGLDVYVHRAAYQNCYFQEAFLRCREAHKLRVWVWKYVYIFELSSNKVIGLTRKNVNWRIMFGKTRHSCFKQVFSHNNFQVDKLVFL